MQSCTLLACLPCLLPVGAAVPVPGLSCKEEGGEFSPSQIQCGGTWEVGKDFKEEMFLSMVSVLSLFALSEKVRGSVLCAVNVFGF